MASRLVMGGAFRSTTPAFKPPARLPIMNRAKTGLYHGKHIMFGNYVAHSERKCRRTWLPNLQKHKYWSELLGKKLDIKLTTETMRCIDKFGGFDRYILKTSSILLGGERSVGNRLKAQMTQAFEQKKNTDAALAIMEEQLAKQSALLQKQAQIMQEKAKNDAIAAATGNV